MLAQPVGGLLVLRKSATLLVLVFSLECGSAAKQAAIAVGVIAIISVALNVAQLVLFLRNRDCLCRGNVLHSLKCQCDMAAFRLVNIIAVDQIIS